MCRLRRPSTPGTEQQQKKSDTVAEPASSTQDEDVAQGCLEEKVTGEKKPPTGPRAVNPTAKYFILKSLTVEDLELSTKNGIWTTQSHNEAALNQAFDDVENVYLIFSANKSGEYYGYARMASKISPEVSKELSWLPKSGQDALSSSTGNTDDFPKAIFTEATDTAPKGRIIDDSARGTIFWEALSDEEVENESSKNEKDGDERVETPVVVSQQTWGKPFKVEWISTHRVPFYRTRGLRNNLNAGQEVKIARDGTELEESAGRRLINMFRTSTATVGAGTNMGTGASSATSSAPAVKTPNATVAMVGEGLIVSS